MDCFFANLRTLVADIDCFNIRSFGSWIASRYFRRNCCYASEFQYPLFRIVDCFGETVYSILVDAMFQYPLFRIVDCFGSDVDGDGITDDCFNIRSFGSWIASLFIVLAVIVS